MTFHPRMYAAVQGFQPLAELRSLALDRMVVDYWRVKGSASAGGSHFVFLQKFPLGGGGPSGRTSGPGTSP